MAAMVFIQIREKLDLPFAFDNQEEPAIRFATHRSSTPQLQGMRLPPETVRLIDETVSLTQAKTSPTDTMFTYPEMGILYILCDRRFPTRSGSHNIDVVSDSFADGEAQRLLRARPAVIVYARPTEADLEFLEGIWRGGRRSGQRDLVAALDHIVEQYQLVDTFQLRQGDTPVHLYLRREP
jgi:hypothetical protein